MDGGWSYFVNRKLDSENVKEVLPEGGASFLCVSNLNFNTMYLHLRIEYLQMICYTIGD